MDKVIDIEERIPSMRKKRRRKANKKFLFILTVFVCALLAILYFQSPLSRIGKISVNSTLLHDQAFYIGMSGLAPDEPLWDFNSSDVEKKLKKVEGVKAVSVSRKKFRDITIKITEWDTVAYLEDEGEFSLLLENGEVFPNAKLIPQEEAPVLKDFGDSTVRKRLTKQLLEIDDHVYQLISEIIFAGKKEDKDSIILYMDDGYEVRADLSTFAERMNYYPRVIAQLNGIEKGVIDMEVGVFFTPYSEVYGLKEEGEIVDKENN
ncbi:cell division protein FtsQ/DivIB [Filibacter tadaridae]|uniref:Cell division protein DivIB n=1 Tax=Filibacter tadaridae TaxID=2483811 RepID=A0A3P5XEQ2_9BACL|nr:cell division protein FtsQ/DivIB [Filibacter tadaridae]VDC29841.1 Cell division protein DivIB [Filibacter tadaridae]